MARKVSTDLDFQNVARPTNLPAATAAGQPVIFEQLNAAIEGQAWKDDVRVAASSNVNVASPGANVDGVAMAAGERVLLKGQTAAAENGIYLWNGAAVAMTRAIDANSANELLGATVPVNEGTSASTTWRQTAINITLGTTAIAFSQFGTSSGPASTSSAGIAQLATQSEVDTGSDALKVVTPATLAGAANRKRKAVGTFGDGSATQYDVTHNFGTRDVEVEVYRNATPWDSILCDVERPDANTVRLRFAAAPTSNQFNVVILG